MSFRELVMSIRKKLRSFVIFLVLLVVWESCLLLFAPQLLAKRDTVNLLLDGLKAGIVALTVGWGVYRYWVERSDKPAVEIGVRVSMSKHNGEWLVFIDCVLTNKGRVNAIASPKEPALADKGESLRFGCSLQIKKFAGARTQRHIDWFGGDGALVAVPGLEEINLVDPYVDPDKRDEDSFWLEPGETQHCGASVILPAGIYLSKVTFVGNRGWDEFWTSPKRKRATNCGKRHDLRPSLALRASVPVRHPLQIYWNGP